MRTFVIGDIHGGLIALKQVLERAAVTNKDTLIFLGDYVDGWSQSPQVIDFLIELKQKQNCICIRGNHDDLLQQWMRDGKDNELWHHHGGESTVLAYESISETHKQIHVSFLESLQGYYLDSENRLFIHAGFTNLRGVTYEYSFESFFWDRTLWETAMALDPNMETDSLLYPKRLKLYKEIFIGHTPVTRIHETVPIQKANVWNVDTGAAFTGRLTILDIDSKEFWQSDPLNELYFDEKGRN
ncbi:metallophosphoesterase family protein [Flavobacterium branchiarum]|uniref:Metallophosphoesterase family protein n=1 Tax=Flavobacterium branchiarum TaxID=1114870 RepID=A0ABV5FPR1_9FLAO|nr:metallophosphoesterase family protein [Flavobacterium branchiarum]MDN3675559.1 metallophosphoesterase family protein [Flavobacterium branchiarum]